MVLIELHRAVSRRLLDRDVGEALGVDLHPYSRRVGTDIPGMELHRHHASSFASSLIASAVNGANNNSAATKVSHFEIASDVKPAITKGGFKELIGFHFK